MKIGILTYQKTTNYGAELQSFALYEYLKRNNQSVEIIDYSCEKITKKNKIFNINNFTGMKKLLKNIIAAPMTYSKQRKFDKFDNLIVYSNNKFTKENIESKLSNYDIYLIGSDQVWNYNLNGGDYTYFFKFISEPERISTYASSFGLSKIESKYIEEYRVLLNRINHLSVREKTGQNIIKKLTGREADLVLDPVFLLDKKEWIEKFHLEIKKKSFVFYFFHKKFSDECISKLRKNNIARKKIIKIAGGLSIKDFFDKHKKVAYNSGPIEFLNYIAEAEFVFTDSFHGVAMSVLLNKPFLVFLTGDVGRDSRIVELLDIVGLSNQIYSTNNFRDVVHGIIDWTSVNEKLENNIRQSKGYLKKLLDDYNYRNKDITKVGEKDED